MGSGADLWSGYVYCLARASGISTKFLAPTGVDMMDVLTPVVGNTAGMDWVSVKTGDFLPTTTTYLGSFLVGYLAV